MWVLPLAIIIVLTCIVILHYAMLPPMKKICGTMPIHKTMYHYIAPVPPKKEEGIEEFEVGDI